MNEVVDLSVKQKDKAIVDTLIEYDDAKRAYLVAKKMAEADLKTIAREGFLTAAEDALMRACLRRAGATLEKIRELIGT